MLELPHTVTGALIASKIPHPYISLPLALLSHFLLDLIPHWDPPLYSEVKKTGQPSRITNKIVIIDTLLSLVAGFFFASRAPNLNQAVIIVLACFLAVAPDAIEGLYYYLGWRKNFLKKIIEFQHRHQGKTGLIPGLIIQAGVILLCFYLLTLIC